MSGRLAVVYICPHDGHITDDPDGPNCSRHELPWFTDCPDCGAPWVVVSKHSLYGSEPDSGDDFCARCTSPAPWLTRAQLLDWVRGLLLASAGRDVLRPTALQLVEALKHLDTMDADDTRTAEVWKRVRESAPKVWKATEPVRHALIGETVKRVLGL